MKISKYLKIFAKGNISNWTEESFVTNIVKKPVSQTYDNENINCNLQECSFYEKLSKIF